MDIQTGMSQREIPVHRATVPPAPTPTRDTHNALTFGPALNASIKQARVLMVGAGGIGCELLKNLVLAGFAQIEIVDLDTIDLSNLNRQFLFRQEHIKKPKALVAKEIAQKFNPNVQIVAHHANIKGPEFGVEWFSGFKIVFNALDNVDARRHVNRMCLTADVPLIESGTTGFNGQVQVIKKGITACYECTPKEAPKSFPVCTIRSTPSQPIHCIVWAKSYLLNEIFGDSEDQSALDTSADQDDAREIEELKKEAEALRQIRQSIGKPEFHKRLFDKVFKTDIGRLRSMEDMWKTRTPPEPLDYESVMGGAAHAIASSSSIIKDGQRVWTLEESLVVLNDSLNRLSRRIQILRAAESASEQGPGPVIVFDKDDDDTLDFVTASANIRSTIFGIERKSRFDVKQMAGNIIPAIATTNAIVAGVCVLESLKVLKGQYNGTKEVILTPFRPARLLAPDKSREPNPDCPVCSAYRTSAWVDLERATLNDLVNSFLKLELGYGERDISVSSDVGILYDPDETENLNKKLSALGIMQDSFLTIVDEDDIEPLVNVVLSIRAANGQDVPVKAVSSGTVQVPRKSRTIDQSLTLPSTNGEGETRTVADGSTKKRGPESPEPTATAKRKKTAAPVTTDDDIILVDNGPSGAIMIDDD